MPLESCPHCGYAMAAGSRYCRHCRFVFAPAPTGRELDARVLMLSGAAVIATLFLFGAMFSGRHHPALASLQHRAGAIHATAVLR